MNATFNSFDDLQAEDVYADDQYIRPVDLDLEDEFNDDMDGDMASGLASAGFGTDEDYNHFDYGFDFDVDF